jgi:hypothetical protein
MSGGRIEVGNFVTSATGPADWVITDVAELEGRASIAIADGRQAVLVSGISAAVGDDLQLRVSVRNGVGAAIGSSATFDLSVRVTNERGFLAGYSARRPIIIAARRSAETVTGFILRVGGKFPDLRSVAHGGRVHSPTGNDIRFTTATGVKLPHELVTYDPVTGEIRAWVRLSSWTMNSRYALFMYYGNQTQAAVPEADWRACWVDYLGVWDCRSGADRTGNGHDFAMANVEAGVLVGQAGRFNGTDGAGEMASCAWLDDLQLTACTLQVWATTDPAAIGQNRGVLLAGLRVGRAAEQSLALYQRASNATGSVVNNWFFNVSTGDGSGPEQQGWFVSSANRQTSTPQLIHAVWSSGSPPSMSFDGVEDVGSGGVRGIASGALRALPLHDPGRFYLGWGPDTRPPIRPAFPADGPWMGLLDELRLRSGVLTLAHRRAEYLSGIDPQGFCGIGDPEAADGEVTPIVGLPVRATVAADNRQGVLISVLDRVVNPGGAALSLAEVHELAPPIGTIAAENGKVRYVPDGVFTGIVSAVAEVQAMTSPPQSCSLKVRIDVTPAESGGGSTIDDLPDPAEGRVFRMESATELQRYLAGQLPGAGAPQPGDHVVLLSGRTYQLPDGGQTMVVNVAGEGSAPRRPKTGRPIVFRGESLADPPVLDFTFAVKGHDLVFYGLKWQGYEARRGNQRIFTITGERVRVGRCWFLDFWHKHNLDEVDGKWLNRGAGVGCVAFKGGGSFGRVDHCELSPRAFVYDNLNADENLQLVGVRRGIGFSDFSASNLKNCVVDHNYFHDFPSKLQPDGARDIKGVAWRGHRITLNCYDNRYPSCLVMGEDGSTAMFELRTTAYRNFYFRCNQSRDANVAETKSSGNLWYQEYFKDDDAFFATRQGWNNRMIGIRADGLRKFDVYGNRQEVRGLWMRNSMRGLQIMAGNTPGDQFRSNRQPACWNSLFAGCDVDKIKVAEAFGGFNEVAKNLRLERIRVGDGDEGTLWSDADAPPPGVSLTGRVDRGSLKVTDQLEGDIPEVAPVLKVGVHVGPLAPSVLPEGF